MIFSSFPVDGEKNKSHSKFPIFALISPSERGKFHLGNVDGIFFRPEKDKKILDRGDQIFFRTGIYFFENKNSPNILISHVFERIEEKTEEKIYRQYLTALIIIITDYFSLQPPIYCIISPPHHHHRQLMKISVRLRAVPIAIFPVKQIHEIGQTLHSQFAFIFA